MHRSPGVSALTPAFISIRSAVQAFEDLWKAMIVLKIDENIMDGIFSVVSAVLHIGNLTFEDIDGESVGLTASDKKVVETVAKLLKVRFDVGKPCIVYTQIEKQRNVTAIVPLFAFIP